VRALEYIPTQAYRFLLFRISFLSFVLYITAGMLNSTSIQINLKIWSVCCQFKKFPHTSIPGFPGGPMGPYKHITHLVNTICPLAPGSNKGIVLDTFCSIDSLSPTILYLKKWMQTHSQSNLWDSKYSSGEHTWCRRCNVPATHSDNHLFHLRVSVKTTYQNGLLLSTTNTRVWRYYGLT